MIKPERLWQKKFDTPCRDWNSWLRFYKISRLLELVNLNSLNICFLEKTALLRTATILRNDLQL